MYIFKLWYLSQTCRYWPPLASPGICHQLVRSCPNRGDRQMSKELPWQTPIASNKPSGSTDQCISAYPCVHVLLCPNKLNVILLTFVVVLAFYNEPSWIDAKSTPFKTRVPCYSDFLRFFLSVKADFAIYFSVIHNTLWTNPLKGNTLTAWNTTEEMITCTWWNPSYSGLHHFFIFDIEIPEFNAAITIVFLHIYFLHFNKALYIINNLEIHLMINLSERKTMQLLLLLYFLFGHI